MPKLSVITVCYNEPNLEKTCESIVNQTWQDFEWIVIDGGSNQETQKIWDKYKYRIDKFVSEDDNGVYDAMNKGIKFANGEYLNFLNAGDSYIDKDTLKNVFELNNYNEDILYGDECYTCWRGKENYLSKMPQIVDKNFLIYSTIRHQSSFIKKQLFDKFGLYETKYTIVSDWKKWIIFLTNGITFKYIPQTIALYDTKGRSFTKEFQNLHDKERQEVLKEYFSEREIKSAFEEYTDKFNFLEKFFSIKNSKISYHKIITFLGIHLKIKRSR